jgi:arsenate reductase
MSEPRNILFLCTGNSARSVLAEGYTNSRPERCFKAFSAGSHPKGQLHPLTLEALRDVDISTTGLRSKSWDEFAQPGAPQMNFVITVCDSAAGEVCPVWPGQPISAHWSFADPAAYAGTDSQKRAFFREIFRQIRARVDLLHALPLPRLDSLAVKRELDSIGRTDV